MPEVKDKESSACFMGTQRTLFRLTSFKFARFSLSDRWYRYRYFLIANIRIFSLCNEKNATLLQKTDTAFTAAKV